MYTKYTKTKKILITLVICATISIFTVSNIRPAFAVGLSVPIDTDVDYHTIMDNLKSFALDKIASTIAKQILHQMTMSVVGWINSGFKGGNPAFLKNPKAFFMNATEQVANQFINTGPLSGLCSPFQLDIQANLNLSVGQTNNSNNYQQKYGCTIDKIIQNVKKGPSVNVGLNIGSSGGSGGASVDGFMNGDFSQGGWPAMMSMLTEPQNNSYSAYLMAQDDLQKQIADKKASINADLSMGNGFLSWQDCQPSDSSDPNANGVYDESTGNTTFEDCTTATPGSTISDSLNKSLGAGQDQLVQANDINSVINALMEQLVTVALNDGLSSLSGHGKNASYINNAIAKSGSKVSASISATNAVTALTSSASTYDQAIAVASSTLNSYLQVKACFADIVSTSSSTSQIATAQRRMASIDQIINRSITPLISDLQTGKAAVTAAVTQAQQSMASTSVGLASDLTQTQAMIDAGNTYFQNSQTTVQNVIVAAGALSKTANQALVQANSLNTSSTKTIQQYQQECNQLSFTFY